MLKPLEDRIILKVDKKEETTSASGLIIQAAQDIEKVATVITGASGLILTK